MSYNYEDIVPMTMTKCRCRHPSCNQYRLRGQRTQGFEKEDAEFICNAVNFNWPLASFFIDCLNPGEKEVMRSFESPEDMQHYANRLQVLYSRGLIAITKVEGFKFMQPTPFGWYIKETLDAVDKRHSEGMD